MIRSRWSKLFGALPVVLALAGLAGCNNPNTDDDTDVAASELDAPAHQGKEHARGGHHRGHGGPAMLLGAALHELDLSDAQKSTIKAELDALRPTDEAHKEHEAGRAALAAAVRSGQIDENALLAKMAPKAPDTARLAKAIGVLHDTLTTAQRKELVASVQARMDRAGGPDGEHGMRPDHDDERGARDRRPGTFDKGSGMRGPLGHLLGGLSLTDSQRDKVQDALSKLAPSEADHAAKKAQHEAFRAAMRERLASFAADSFDASAFVAPPQGAGKPGPEAMAGHMIKALAVVVPILDDAQRAELADRLEKGPPAMKGMHKRHAPEGR